MGYNKKQHKRVMIFAYSIIALISIGLFLCTILIKTLSAELESLFIGLSASGVFAVILMLNLRFFMLDTDDALVAKIETSVLTCINNVHTTKEYDAYADFFGKIKTKKITQLDMYGYSMAHILETYLSTFVDMLNKNVRINILLLDPDGTGGDVMKEFVPNRTTVGAPHRRTIEYINRILDKIPVAKHSKCTVRKTSWIPSCTMMIAKDKQENYTSLIGINGFDLNDKEMRRLYTVYDSHIDDVRVNFYSSHFNAIWKRGNTKIVTIKDE